MIYTRPIFFAGALLAMNGAGILGSSLLLFLFRFCAYPPHQSSPSGSTTRCQARFDQGLIQQGFEQVRTLGRSLCLDR